MPAPSLRRQLANLIRNFQSGVASAVMRSTQDEGAARLRRGQHSREGVQTRHIKCKRGFWHRGQVLKCVSSSNPFLGCDLLGLGEDLLKTIFFCAISTLVWTEEHRVALLFGRI